MTTTTAAIRNWKGDLVTLSSEDLTAFAATIRGKILYKSNDDPTYNEACKVWNAMIDRKPGMIVQCTGNADVVSCVKFCHGKQLKICVRGGGHNIAGKSIQDDHFMIDLSQWRNVSVDPVQQIIRVAPGTTLGDIDHETKEFGLVHAHGVNSTTGVSGLVLGGGMGWLCRKYGMSCDNLVSAQVVTYDGKIIRASADEHADLFWALKGGSGNFGIVTEFQLKVHKLESPEGHTVQAGPIVYAGDDAKQVLLDYAKLVKAVPRDMSAYVAFRQAPPFPFVPEEHHFKPVVIIAVCYIGPEATAEENIQPFTQLGGVTPLGVGVGRMPLANWNQAFDPLMGPGARGYWKSCNYKELSDSLIDTMAKSLATIPNFGSDFFLAPMGGAVNDVPVDATAYAHRNVDGLINCHMRWEYAADDDTYIQWARDLFTKFGPDVDDSAYLNFVSADEEVAEVNIFDQNNARLAEIKKKYDPNNFFSETYKIRPSA